jgi:hypothetical protein
MNWAKFASLVELIVPGILFGINPSFGYIASDVVALIKSVQTPGATGVDKLNAVITGAAAVVAQVNTNAGKQLVNPTLITTDLPTAISLGIDIVNKVGGQTPITNVLQPTAVLIK